MRRLKPWYRGCGPTAAANIVYYWDKKGYPNLVANGRIVYSVIDELADYMKTTTEGLTYPWNLIYGLKTYLDKCYSNFTVGGAYRDIRIIKENIDNNAPLIVLLTQHPTYGYHYVTVVGYAIYPDVLWLVVHDTWPETPTNVNIRFPDYISSVIVVLP